MASRNRTAFCLGVAAGLAAVAAWRLYAGRARDRVQGNEGLDDPAVARGFECVAVLPPMRALRWYAVHRSLALRSSGRAVDLGCGSGRLAVELASAALNLRVTGVDLSAEMLEMARRKVADGERTMPGLFGSRVDFRLGDAARIPFDDAEVDLVVSTLSLHHWSDPVQVLDEVSRVLRPQGSFMILDLRRDMAFPFWLLVWFASHVVVPRSLRSIREPLASRDASYTCEEIASIAGSSQLSGWRVARGPFWLILEGTKDNMTTRTGHPRP